MADPSAHQTRLGGARRLDQPDRVGLDDILRPVLPVAAISIPATRQHLSDAMGSEEISTVTQLQTVQGMVVRTHRSRTRPVQALGVEPRFPVGSMRRAE